MDAGSAGMFPSAAYEVFLWTNPSSALVLLPLLPLLPGWSPLPLLGWRLEEPEMQQGEIEDFLGNEIAPVVIASKQKEHEKISLHVDLTILELDNLLDQSNTKSVPGPNGFSYKFIKTFWVYSIPGPLFDCAGYGLENIITYLTFLKQQISS